MNLDDTIRAMAALGRSKGQLREALGISRNTFAEIVKLLPDIEWQLSAETLAAMRAGARRAAEIRKAKHLHTVNGITGSIPDLCAWFGQCTPQYARRRIQQGMTVAQAVTTPLSRRRKRA